MTYQIKYYYKTGNSYGSSDEEGILELEYESLDKAKETIKRIKEHWKWYKYKDSSFRFEKNEVKRPGWHKTPPDIPSYCDPWNNINLIAETGKEVFFWPDWVGYFERLYGVKIIRKNPEEDDMEYWTDEYKKWDYK